MVATTVAEVLAEDTHELSPLAGLWETVSAALTCGTVLVFALLSTGGFKEDFDDFKACLLAMKAWLNLAIFFSSVHDFGECTRGDLVTGFGF